MEESRLLQWTIQTRDIAAGEDMRTELELHGVYLYFSEHPSRGHLAHFVGRVSTLKRLRKYWIEEELLVVRSTGQTNRGQPMVLEEVPPEQGGPAEAPPIGGDYLCVAMWV